MKHRGGYFISLFLKNVNTHTYVCREKEESRVDDGGCKAEDKYFHTQLLTK